MDTMDIVIPTSVYVYERERSVRRLRSMMLKYSLKSESHPELYVSTEMKSALSWYLRLKINFFSMTDALVRKYFFYVVSQRPQEFIVNKSVVDDDTLVVIPTSVYVYERVRSVRLLRSMMLKYSLKTESHPELYVSTEMKRALSWYLSLTINFFSMKDVIVRKYFFYVVSQRPQDFIVNKSDTDDDTRVVDAVEGSIDCRERSEYYRFM